MAKIYEILAIQDIGERINELKKHRGKHPCPNTPMNFDDWVPERHEIMTNKEKYPDNKILTQKGKVVISQTTGKHIKTDDVYKIEEANRICVPIEQDITNIHTAFTVGTEPKLICDTDDEEEKKLLKALKFTLKKNFIKYKNKKEVRAALSEQEVAEYWYMEEDTDGFWSKMWKKFKASVGVRPQKRPRCVVWSPFRGDELYPFFEDENMTGFLRGYKLKQNNDSFQQCYMCITDKYVYTWKKEDDGWSETVFAHNFGKMPVIYMYFREPIARKIRTLRIRLEKLMSEYADCVDYHFFPYLLLFGEIDKLRGESKNHIIQMMGKDANAQYLTWNQVPDTVKFEVESLIERIYSLTNTPRISLDDLRNITPASGIAFKFLFMGAHMAVQNHAEVIGEFMQRRINFLTTALGKINADLYTASQTIDVDAEIVPYMIDDLAGKIQMAANAKNARMWSNRECIMFLGNLDHVDESIKEIMDEMRSDNQMEIDKAVAIAKGQAEAQQTDK